MNKKLLSFLLLFSALFFFESCLDSDTDGTYYDDTAITAFSVGTLKREVINSSGNDTIISIDCSSYNFYIDQLNHEVYNVDSLPVGVDASKVVCTLTTKNNGIAVYKDSTDSWLYYYSTDSLDFTEPLAFRVYSTSGNYYQDYTVHVNVHKEVADTFIWKANATFPVLQEMTAMHAVELNSKIYIFGVKDGQTTILSGNQSDLSSFTESTSTLDAEASKSVLAFGDYVYTVSNGDVVRSKNVLDDYEVVASNPGVKQLIGATSKNIYALSTDNKLVASRDNGATWSEEELDEDASYLPVSDISMTYTPVKTNANMERAVIVGKSTQNTKNAVVWNKVVNYNNDVESWQYLEITSDNQYQAPYATSFQTTLYNDSIEGFDGETLYKSRDNGMTWYPDDKILMPEAFVSNKDNFAFFSDDKGFLWVITNGTIWKGRRNELGWE